MVTIEEFKNKFYEDFAEFSEHITVSWYLSNTKGELEKMMDRRLHNLNVTSDFAENVVALLNHELSEQHFHKVEILLHGSLTSFIVEEEGESEMRVGPDGDIVRMRTQSHKLETTSYMVSSDYR